MSSQRSTLLRLLTAQFNLLFQILVVTFASRYYFALKPNRLLHWLLSSLGPDKRRHRFRNPTRTLVCIWVEIIQNQLSSCYHWIVSYKTIRVELKVFKMHLFYVV